MNITLMVAFWRQRLTSPIRVVLLGVTTAFPVLGVAFMHGAGLSALGDSLVPVLILGAGMIGQDVSSGVLQLLFARPVRRPDYVLSRWLGVAIAASVVALLQIALALALLAARHALPGAQEVLFYAGGRVLQSVGLAAVLALLSSLAPGLGDLALYLLAALGGNILQMIAQWKSWAWMGRAGREFLATIQPNLDLAQLVHASPLPWFPIVSFASTVTLCLALAIVAVNRKELSYASG